MNYGDIVSRVSILVWGSSPADPGTVGILYGTEGVVSNVVREIQRDYNYWFMALTTALAVQGYVQTYDVPDGFKEFRAAMWKYEDDDSDGFSLPLKLITTTEGVLLWNSDTDTTAEYPDYIEVNGDSFTLYPDPNPNYPLTSDDSGYDDTLTRELHILYWGYLDRVNVVAGSTDEDAVTIHAADAVIYLSAAYMCELNGEYDRAALYRMRASEGLDNLKKEDKKRRQKAARRVQPVRNKKYYTEV